jgi:hypothetical protein
MRRLGKQPGKECNVDGGNEPIRYQQQSRLMRLQLSLTHLEHLGILQGFDKQSSDWRKGIKLLRNVIAKAAEGEK